MWERLVFDDRVIVREVANRANNLFRCECAASDIEDYLVASSRSATAEASPPKKARMFLKACVKVAEERLASTGSAATKTVVLTLGGRHPVNSRSRKPESCMMRRSLTQGAPFKCPLIRERLFDWFVDVRRSIAGRISPKFVLMKARSIAEQTMKIQRATGHYTPMPKLDKHWLLRWKRDKGIVFRKPNQRFKTSKQKMIVRLRAMWLNVIRVRRLGQRLLGHDLGDRIFGVDEKPLHFNEGGSKNVRTLELQGAPAVKLKENHAASRERVSVMTSVTSDAAAVNQPGRLPVFSSYDNEGRTRRHESCFDILRLLASRHLPRHAFGTSALAFHLRTAPWLLDLAYERGWV